MPNDVRQLEPIPAIAADRPYAVPRPFARIDLRLDGNEGRVPPRELVQRLADISPQRVRDYPTAQPLEALLAKRFDLPDASHVLATAGADDALYRAMRAMLASGRELIIPVPTFEMLHRYARLCDATEVRIDWPGCEYPTRDVIERIGDRTAMILIVSPNNPTGAAASIDDLHAIARAAPHALIVIDTVYADFADVDLTHEALQLDNALVVGSFSKSRGLAGLRVGYAAAKRADVVRWLRVAGNPYPVAAPSIALTMDVLQRDNVAVHRAFVARVRDERSKLESLLRSAGARPVPSQANFVFARFDSAEAVWRALGGHGISVRKFESAQLADALRITCPGDETAFERLHQTLQTVLK